MKKIIIFLVIFSAGAPAEVTPATVKQQVEKHGPVTIQTFINDSAWYGIIVSKVGRGDAGWIATIPWLKEISDEARRTALIDAAQIGLIHNPKAMLEVLDSIDRMSEAGKTEFFDTDNICFGLLADISKSSYLRFYSATKKALSAEGESAKNCLKVLESVHDEILVDDRNGTIKWGIRPLPAY